MQLNKEILKRLEDWGYKLESETPLIITQERDDLRLVDTVAWALINEMENDIRSNPLDLEELDKLDDSLQLLVTANVNYADEFDMSEFTVMSVSDFKDLVNKLTEYDDEISWSFGTNEEMQFSDGQELLSCLEFRVITDEEASVLHTLFGGEFDGGAGTFQHIYEAIDGEDDEDEDDDEDSMDYDEEDEEEGEFAGFCLDSFELKQIETLRSKGWKIEPHDVDIATLKFTDVEGNMSICEYTMISELTNYLRKKQ